MATTAKIAVKKRGRPRKIQAKKPESAVVQTVSEKSPVKKAVSKSKYYYALGRRKTATAKVMMFTDKQDWVVNSKSLDKYFQTKNQQKIAIGPLSLLGQEKTIGLIIHVAGGGKQSQAEAVRLGIARALILKNLEDRPLLKKAGYLTRDPRVKERKKPGLKRARRGPQWAKR